MTKAAVILAGGKGKRLKPYTLIMPKPLMPLNDKPILEILIRKLSKHGFKKIYIAANYRADIIKAFFGNGKKFGVEIVYSVEKKELGTAAPITLLKKLEFVTCNTFQITFLFTLILYVNIKNHYCCCMIYFLYILLPYKIHSK